LLEKLYGKLVIPHSVLDELEEGKKEGEHIPDTEFVLDIQCLIIVIVLIYC